MARVNRKSGGDDALSNGTDPLVKMGTFVDKEAMKNVKNQARKQAGMKKIASGISVSPPSYYNPLYTPTSLQLPRDRKQINVWSFAPGTKVLMANGTEKLIQDIEIGDLVLSANNIVRPITHKYINEVSKNMVTIEAGGNSLSVTHDHICYVIEDKDFEYAQSAGLNIKDFVKEKYASEIIESDWMFRTIPNGVSELKDSRLAYLLGAYLAEGYIYDFHVNKGVGIRTERITHSVELRYGLNEKHIVDKIVGYCNDFNYNNSVKKDKNTYRIYIRSHEFALICQKSCGQGSKNKILSNDILFADESILQSFMNGYIDGDGHQEKVSKMIQFATASNNLASQLKSIVFPRLGIISSDINYMAGKSLNGGIGYNANHLRIPRRYAYKFEGCSKDIDIGQGNLTLANKRRIVNKNGFVFYQVKNVESKPYVGIVYDITVDQDFNLIGNFYSIRNCRHFYNTEAIPAAVIDLYASLPITSWTIECANPQVRKYMEDMCKRLKLREVLQGIALEYFMIGDVFIMSELDEQHKTWKNLTILNPDQVEVQRSPFVAEPVIDFIPDDNIKKIIFDRNPPELYNHFRMFLPDVVEAVKAGKPIPIDPAHITHLKHMPTPYGVYGTPLLKRIFKTLMYKEMLRRAQFVIAERYVTPLKIFKLGTIDEPPPQEEIDNMQAQLDAVLNDPSLVLVTTQRLTADWQGISGKTLQLSGEYDFTEREMIAGLGVSRAFLDGLGPCLSHAGEALTNNGFKNYSEIDQENDLLARYNLETHSIEWIKPMNYHAQFYNGDMIRFKTNKIDLLVSPNHKMPVQFKQNGMWTDTVILEAQDLLEYSLKPGFKNKNFRFISTFDYEGTSPEFVEIGKNKIAIKDFMFLAGYFASEGSIVAGRYYETGGIQNRQHIRISQKKSSLYFEEIDMLMKRLPSSWNIKYYGHDFLIQNDEVVEYFKKNFYVSNKEFRSTNKSLPSYVRNFDKNDLKILLAALCNGDGSYRDATKKTSSNKQYRTYISSSTKLISDVQEIGLKLGYATKVSKKKLQKKKDSNEFNNQTYALYISEGLSKNKKDVIGHYPTINKTSQISKETYNGIIWCPDVGGSQIFVARDNGLVVLSHNTYANASIGGNAFLQKLENFRETLKTWIEEKIFKPICELNDYYDADPDTDEEFLIKVEFKWDALRLQDEASRQQALLSLRQQSLLSAKTLLNAYHINPETEAINLAEERDTIFDMNRILARQIRITQETQMGLQYQMQQLMGGAGGMMPQMPGQGTPPAAPGQKGSTPPPGGDALSGMPGAPMGTLPSGSFAPLDSAGSRPPIAANQTNIHMLKEMLKEVRAALRDKDD